MKIEVASFAGQQKERADSIMGSFSKSSNNDHTLLGGAIIVCFLLVILLAVLRSNSKSKR